MHFFCDLTDIFNDIYVVVCKKNIVPLVSDRYDSEEPKYDYKNPGFSPETGHFTQVHN